MLADGPSAYWRLGETAGWLAADSSGNGHVGLFTNVTLGVAGALGNDANTAARFNGTDGQVTFLSDAALRLNGSWTIEFWARQISFVHTKPGILGRGLGDTKDTYSIYAEANGQLWLRRNNKLVGSGAGALGSAYRYFAVTYDGTFVRWYMNGVLKTTSAIAYPAASGPQLFQIGKAQEAGHDDVDEVALYPTALSAARIAAHYASGS